MPDEMRAWGLSLPSCPHGWLVSADLGVTSVIPGLYTHREVLLGFVWLPRSYQNPPDCLEICLPLELTQVNIHKLDSLNPGTKDRGLPLKLK